MEASVRAKEAEEQLAQEAEEATKLREYAKQSELPILFPLLSFVQDIDPYESNN